MRSNYGNHRLNCPGADRDSGCLLIGCLRSGKGCISESRQGGEAASRLIHHSQITGIEDGCGKTEEITSQIYGRYRRRLPDESDDTSRRQHERQAGNRRGPAANDGIAPDGEQKGRRITQQGRVGERRSFDAGMPAYKTGGKKEPARYQPKRAPTTGAVLAVSPLPRAPANQHRCARGEVPEGRLQGAISARRTSNGPADRMMLPGKNSGKTNHNEAIVAARALLERQIKSGMSSEPISVPAPSASAGPPSWDGLRFWHFPWCLPGYDGGDPFQVHGATVRARETAA